MLYIATWFWGTKYDQSYVAKLRAGVERHLKRYHFWMVIEPEPEYFHLTTVPGCLIRLRMFDPEWQARVGIGPNDQLVCMDLDTIVTGSLDRLFNRPEPFVILQGANSQNPCPYNGSLMMLRGGAHPEVWHDFTPEALADVPVHEFVDDQGWLAHKVPGAAGWRAGAESGVFAFQKPGWPKMADKEALPGGASLVVFPGWRDPSKFTHLPWVKKHWTV